LRGPTSKRGEGRGRGRDRGGGRIEIEGRGRKGREGKERGRIKGGREGRRKKREREGRVYCLGELKILATALVISQNLAFLMKKMQLSVDKFHSNLYNNECRQLSVIYTLH